MEVNEFHSELNIKDEYEGVEVKEEDTDEDPDHISEGSTQTEQTG